VFAKILMQLNQTKKFADVIIPRGADNFVAIDLIVQHIQSKLDEKIRWRKQKASDDTLFGFEI
jgi:uridine kinase